MCFHSLRSRQNESPTGSGHLREREGRPWNQDQDGRALQSDGWGSSKLLHHSSLDSA